MVMGSEVLQMLLPDGGWVARGNDFKDVEFIDCEPLTKAQFEAGFAQYDAWKLQQAEAKATAKAQLLNRLGITEDEAKLLLS